jgi:CRP/FNR family cyclic AMP-dependent transcriptional regulator
LQILQQDGDPWVQHCAHLAASSALAGDDPMALSTLERVFFLKGVLLFKPIPGEQIARFAPILKEVPFSQGETFIQRDEVGECLYIVVEGEVEVRRDENLFSVKLTEAIGERAVLTETPRRADYTAKTEIVALRISKDDFWELMREQPGLTIKVMRVVFDHYVSAE